MERLREKERHSEGKRGTEGESGERGRNGGGCEGRKGGMEGGREVEGQTTREHSYSGGLTEAPLKPLPCQISPLLSSIAFDIIWPQPERDIRRTART
eukprot:6187195-Pleurochrysis_carterae.AAC.2